MPGSEDGKGLSVVIAGGEVLVEDGVRVFLRFLYFRAGRRVGGRRGSAVVSGEAAGSAFVEDSPQAAKRGMRRSAARMRVKSRLYTPYSF